MDNTTVSDAAPSTLSALADAMERATASYDTSCNNLLTASSLNETLQKDERRTPCVQRRGKRNEGQAPEEGRR